MQAEPHDDPSPALRVTLSPRAAGRGMASAVAFLAIAGLAVNLAPLVITQPSKGMLFLLEQFQMDGEGNIPTWFASVLLLSNASLFALIGAGHRGENLQRAGWFGLSAIFVLLSVDEAVSLHEAAGRAFSRLTGLGGGETFAWLIPAVPVMAGLGVIFLRFVVGLPGRTRVLVLLAGGVFLSGAMGAEAIGWAVDRTPGRWDWTYQMVTLVEEVLELAGQALLFYALVDCMAQTRLMLRVDSA